VRRDSIFEAVATCIPSIFSYVVSAYETPSSLIYETYTLQSSEGSNKVTRWVPFSSALLSQKHFPKFHELLQQDILTTSHWVTQSKTSVVKSSSFRWKHQKLDLILIMQNVRLLSPAESRSDWMSSGLFYLEPSMDENILLGSPLYNDGFLPILNSHIASLSTMSKRLKLMSSHEAFFLYRNLLSIPKLLHLLCSSPCWETPIIANVVCSQQTTISELLNISI